MIIKVKSQNAPRSKKHIVYSRREGVFFRDSGSLSEIFTHFNTHDFRPTNTFAQPFNIVWSQQSSPVTTYEIPKSSTWIDPTVFQGLVDNIVDEIFKVLMYQVPVQLATNISAQDDTADDDWTLDTSQMFFMMRHNNEIQEAYKHDDMQALRDLAATDEFQAIFHDMSFDEAYDRYECALEEE